MRILLHHVGAVEALLIAQLDAVHRFNTPSCLAASTFWPRPVVFRW